MIGERGIHASSSGLKKDVQYAAIILGIANLVPVASCEKLLTKVTLRLVQFIPAGTMFFIGTGLAAGLG